jgi:hypothetical protein
LAIVPWVFHGRNDPEVAFGIPHNPLLGKPIHIQGHFSIPFSNHVNSKARVEITAKTFAHARLCAVWEQIDPKLSRTYGSAKTPRTPSPEV